MRHKHTEGFLVGGILLVGLLILGLTPVEGNSPLFSPNRQDSTNDQNVLMAASISKETLLVLLAVGIAGALGLSRKKKNIKNNSHKSDSEGPSDP